MPFKRVPRQPFPETLLKESPLGTVVMPNLNGGDMVLEALNAVLSQSIAGRLRVVVVDNASTDGSPDAIEKQFHNRVILIRSTTNLGFAAGNNLGFRHADGRYLLLLNNDAVPEPHWAEELVKAAESDPTVGMCTSRIVAYHDHGLIDCVGHNIFIDGLNRSRGNWQRDVGQYEQAEETLHASGCAALYLRDAVMNWGGFDEEFFAYGDDTDLGLKLRLGGLRCLYVPSAVVYHHGSAAEGAHSYNKVFLIERNRVWVLLKYFPWTWILLSPIYTFARLFLGALAALRGHGRAGAIAGKYSMLGLVHVILHAWLAALWRAPRMIGKRRRLMKKRKISAAEFRGCLRRFRATLAEMTFG